MTTVACADLPGGRTCGNQIWMRPHAVPGLRRLTEAIHAEGAIQRRRPVAAPALQPGDRAPVRFLQSDRYAVRPERRPARIDDVLAARHAARLASSTPASCHRKPGA